MPPKGSKSSEGGTGHAASASNKGRLPKSWPADLTYLTAPMYSKAMTTDVCRQLHVAPTGTTKSSLLKIATNGGTAATVRITSITNPTHPANGQHGLFAAQHLPPDSLILLYLGFVHAREDTDPTSDYDLTLDRELGIGVDASKMGNEARFINDYRGIGPAPNAEFREVWIDAGGGKAEKRMAVFVLSAGKSGKRAKGIPKGEEILVSYGKGFWKERKTEEAEGPEVLEGQHSEHDT